MSVISKLSSYLARAASQKNVRLDTAAADGLSARFFQIIAPAIMAAAGEKGVEPKFNAFVNKVKTEMGNLGEMKQRADEAVQKSSLGKTTLAQNVQSSEAITSPKKEGEGASNALATENKKTFIPASEKIKNTESLIPKPLYKSWDDFSKMKKETDINKRRAAYTRAEKYQTDMAKLSIHAKEAKEQILQTHYKGYSDERKDEMTYILPLLEAIEKQDAPAVMELMHQVKSLNQYAEEDSSMSEERNQAAHANYHLLDVAEKFLNATENRDELISIHTLPSIDVGIDGAKNTASIADQGMKAFSERENRLAFSRAKAAEDFDYLKETMEELQQQQGHRNLNEDSRRRVDVMIRFARTCLYGDKEAYENSREDMLELASLHSGPYFRLASAGERVAAFKAETERHFIATGVAIQGANGRFNEDSDQNKRANRIGMHNYYDRLNEKEHGAITNADLSTILPAPVKEVEKNTVKRMGAAELLTHGKQTALLFDTLKQAAEPESEKVAAHPSQFFLNKANDVSSSLFAQSAFGLASKEANASGNEEVVAMLAQEQQRSAIPQSGPIATFKRLVAQWRGSKDEQHQAQSMS